MSGVSETASVRRGTLAVAGGVTGTPDGFRPLKPGAYAPVAAAAVNAATAYRGARPLPSAG